MNKLSNILPLFLVIFVDTLGAAFIIPLLSPLYLEPSTSILPPTMPLDFRNFLYGLTLGIYSIAAFFGAPILGDLSDRMGRKKILLICLLGVFTSYILFSLGILYQSVIMLIIARIIGGLTAGSLSAAQASIIDLSTPENKTTNIGYILFALSLGYMIGPLIAGTLSNSRWVAWFQLTTPLYCAAILSFLNILFLYFYFKETYVPKEKKPIHLLAGLTVLISAFKMPNLRILSIAFLLLQLGWSSFVQFIGLFLTLRYQFSANEVGVFLGVIGAGFTLAFCYLLKIITRHFSLHKIAIVSISLMALLMLGIIVINNQLSAWILCLPAATGLAIAFSVLTSLFSDQVGADQQGWIMGLTAAIGAFSFGFTGLFSGIIVNWGVNAPIWFAFICLSASAFTILYFLKK